MFLHAVHSVLSSTIESEVLISFIDLPPESPLLVMNFNSTMQAVFERPSILVTNSPGANLLELAMPIRRPWKLYVLSLVVI